MLYKRSKKGPWWVRFSVGGREIRVTSGTDRKELAEQFERQLRERIWREKTLGQEIHYWEEAVERWCEEKKHKRSLERDRYAFAFFAPVLAKRALIDIDRECIERCRQLGGQRKILAAGSVSRNLSFLRSVLNACVKWDWLTSAPRVELPHVKRQDPRWITKEQFERLRKELPPHAAQLAGFAVATGMRRQNVFRLKWRDVDLQSRMARVASSDAKAGKSLGIPLNEDAIAVLRGQSGQHPVYVFTDQRGHAPVGSIKTCWLKAVQRAGLPGFRFHDLRHTWAAWHTLAGTPPMILKELGGWASLAMVERYGALNPGHLADWAGNSSVHKTAQASKNTAKSRGKVDEQ